LSHPETFEFEVPASSANLGPGFGVVGLALNLTMRVLVEPKKKGDAHTVTRRAGVVEQFTDPRHDPILRGLHAAAHKFAVKLPPALHLVVESDVPPACGLGTTSASYACGLAAAARLAKTELPFEELVSELVDLGGDPAHGAAALVGGLVTCSELRGVNGRVHHRVFPHALLDTWRFVFVCPALQLGVAELARLLPASLPHGATARTTGRVLGVLRALALGDEDLLAQCIEDEVHVPYRRQVVPGMAQGMAAAREAGAAAATISGAGPALVAITSQSARCESIGAAMAQAFAQHGVASRTLVLQAREEGALGRAGG
jgi:homoserine kinase